MSFNSLEFIVFAAVFALLWPKIRTSERWRSPFIVAASLVFYGWWDPRFVPLLIVSGLIDFYAARAMESDRTRARIYLVLSMGANLGILFFFKYAAWASAQIIEALGVPSRPSWIADIVLPVGVSFYTFQSMSYTIDVYRRQLRATRDIAHFMAFLSMFPQLVAGPIVRARDLLDQLRTPGHFNADNRWYGLERIARGFVMKCVVADNLAPIVNEAFQGGPDALGGLAWWIAATLFGIQIYCDFAGYSSIAIGIAAWMGYSFRENFAHPYSSRSFREFWTRWHISLSSWFRDYVYVPLGGSRSGPFRGMAALWITMLASGLWHGANWTFLAWGALHAAFLTAERLARKCGWDGRSVLGWPITLLLVIWSWVFFRAQSIGDAWRISGDMWSLKAGAGISIPPSGWLALAAFVTVELVPSSTRPQQPGRILSFRFLLVVAALLAAIFLRGNSGDFIYFQF